MENRIITKVNTWQTIFKKELITVINHKDDKELYDFLNNYNYLELTMDDFKKRKRVKNVIQDYCRCNAKKGNGNQCTRKKKDNIEFCGTHEKSRPYGTIENNGTVNPIINKIDIWYQEIKGIYYYIDQFNNVYLPEDILYNKVNPSVIAKWEKTEDSYNIQDI
jgi:hypothetical protein